MAWPEWPWPAQILRQIYATAREVYNFGPVMWSESIGLRTRPIWDQKNRSLIGLGLARCGLGLGLASLVLCCETRSCTLVVTWRTQQLFKYYLLFLYSVHGTSLLWRSTTALTYLTFHSNHLPISHCFRDKRGENRQFPYPVYVYSPRWWGYPWNWVSAQGQKKNN